MSEKTPWEKWLEENGGADPLRPVIKQTPENENPSPQEDEKVRSARPWDLLNKNIGRVTEEVELERWSICETCPRLAKLTKQCKECGCIMPAKVKLPNAFCPLGKWQAVEIRR